MSKREKEYSRHHILPTSRGGANIPKNIEIIPDVQHRAIHTLFANQLIARQLLTTIDISAKALQPEVKQRLIDILNSRDINDPSERYREECIK